MRAAAVHAWVRLRACCSHPGSAVLLVAGGLMTAAYWPAPMPASAAAGELILLFMWVGLWPAVLMLTITGRSTSATGTVGFGVPMPALPVSRAGRIASETVLVLLLAALARVVGLKAGAWLVGVLTGLGGALPDPGSLPELVGSTAVGVVIMLPSVVLWAVPASSFEIYWLRPHVVAALLVAAVKLGLTATAGGAVLTGTGLTLAAVVLHVLLRRASRMDWRRWFPDRGSLVRPYREPMAQMRRDLWLRALPWAASLAAAELGVVAADLLWSLPGQSVYLASTLVFSSALSLVVLRPAGSKMAISGVWGVPGFRAGDFAAAWAPLPVPRPVLLRGVYLYSLSTGVLIWTGAVAVNLLYAWVETGTLVLRDLDGDPARGVFLLLLVAVPCAAGFVTCAAAGDRFRAYVAGGSLMASIFVQLPMWIAQAPVGLRGLVAVLIVVAGGVPALGLVRRGAVAPGDRAS